MNILTFDIEEWFHLLDNDSTKTADEWSSFESRIHRNMERITTLLQQHGQSATFFCLGWVARKYPEVIRSLVQAGYEIGSHGCMHQLVYEQRPEEFRKDLEQSIRVLEDISGTKVRYYRAPGFSIRQDNIWAFEILSECGIEIDCSIFPAPRAHGGFPAYGVPAPSIVSYRGHQLKELPMSFASIAGRQMVFSGGGYFRLAPYALIRRWTAGSEYMMTYLHPRDFDAGQPVISGLSAMRTFKSYVGLAGAQAKLERWISDFRFVDIRTAEKLIDWASVPVVKLD